MLELATVVLAPTVELVLIPDFQQRNGNGGLGVVTAFVACEPLRSSPVRPWAGEARRPGAEKRTGRRSGRAQPDVVI
jgi:hypothetical protein